MTTVDPDTPDGGVSSTRDDKATFGTVVATALHPSHSFSKPVHDAIELIAGMGVVGDAHFGATVRHRSRVAADPDQPNLRQVHLIHEELHDELRSKGFDVAPGIMGENVTTRGVNLLALPMGTVLRLGREAVVVLTGLRNPCKQLNDYQDGLMGAVLDRTPDGSLVRKAGVMAVVVGSGSVRPGDNIAVALPPKPHQALERV